MKPGLLCCLGLLYLCLLGCTQTEVPEPKEVSISGISVITFPLQDGSSRWDVGSDADLFFKISNSSATLYEHPKEIENVSNAMLPAEFSISPAYKLPVIDQVYHLQLWDLDFPSPNDLIDEISFSPETYKLRAPGYIDIQSASSRIRIYLNWQY